MIAAAANQDYLEFYRTELEYRQQFGYPPFSRMAQLEFRDIKEDRAHDQAERVRQLLDHLGPDATRVFLSRSSGSFDCPNRQSVSLADSAQVGKNFRFECRNQDLAQRRHQIH